MTTTHTLKTDPAVFADVLSGAKTFEIRLNDRDFQVGDTLRLLETEHDGADMRSGAPLIYTGREVTKTVSHILTGYGLADGWCCLSFSPEPPAHEPNAKLLELADRIDHEQLWRWAGMDHDKMTPEQKDRMLAGVNLRRYADLLGNGGWRIYPPRPGFCLRAGSLDEAVSMAKRDEARRAADSKP